MYLVNETLWLIDAAKKNGVSKEDFLLWLRENQQAEDAANADNQKI